MFTWGENPKFFQILRYKKTRLEKFLTKILFNICHRNSGLAIKSKTIASQNFVYFIRENSQKLMSKMQVRLVNEAPVP
jgi:hypothetical protein